MSNDSWPMNSSLSSAPGGSGIYAIRSLIDERCYVGSAVSIYNRWKGHRTSLRKGRHENPKLQNFYNKYGESCLEFVVLEFCSKIKLVEREQLFLDRLTPEFNVHPNARSPLGRKFTAEMIEKCRKAQQRRFEAERAAGIKRVSPMKGKRHSSQAKAKLRAARLGREMPEEVKRKISAALLGVPCPARGKSITEERKAQMRVCWIGRKHSEETKAKMRAAQLGKEKSPEHRAKLSEAAKMRAATPEGKAQLRAATKKSCETKRGSK